MPNYIFTELCKLWNSLCMNKENIYFWLLKLQRKKVFECWRLCPVATASAMCGIWESSRGGSTIQGKQIVQCCFTWICYRFIFPRRTSQVKHNWATMYDGLFLDCDIGNLVTCLRDAWLEHCEQADRIPESFSFIWHMPVMLGS